MHLVMLDTCVWLDISSQKAELPMLTALEHLVEEGVIKLLVPELVRTEFERNKDRVIEATRKRIASEFRVVKGIIESFGGEENAVTYADPNLLAQRVLGSELFSRTLHVGGHSFFDGCDIGEALAKHSGTANLLFRWIRFIELQAWRAGQLTRSFLDHHADFFA